MRVSIVTISFNQAQYLERALLSVLGQSHRDLEYIVVDPGSTDGSREIIERYRDRIAHVVFEPDGGPADGLNRGFARATGEIFAYLNADDVLLPGAVSEVVEYFAQHVDTDVVCGNGFIIDGEGRPVRRFRSTPFTVGRWARGGVTIMQQATFFRRESFAVTNGFNVENRAIWDAELLLDFGIHGKRIKNVKSNWALFTIHHNSISGSKYWSEEVRTRIESERARLVQKALGKPPRRLAGIARIEGRIEKWLHDPVGFVLRIGEAIGVELRLGPAETKAARAAFRERAPRVALISHAYIEPQIRKNASALAEIVDLRVLSPRRWDVLVFTGVNFVSAEGERQCFQTYRTPRLPGAQYLLPTLTMGFRHRRPDVISIEYDPWNLIFWQTLICRWLFARHTPIVCHVKKNTYRAYSGVRGRIKKSLAKAGIRRVDYFLAASEMAARVYVSTFAVDPQRIAIVPHLGVDLGTFVPRTKQERDTLVVGYCGQFAEHKGVMDLVEAVGLVRDSIPLQLRMLGRGELEAELVSFASNCSWLQLEPAVPNMEVSRFLADLDIFVMPSRILPDHQEHDGLALVEALAVGLPVIGTRSGIIPEILADGCGVLVEPGDPQMLAGAIAMLAADPGRCADLGIRARGKAEEFDLSVVAAKKAAILREVPA